MGYQLSTTEYDVVHFGSQFYVKVNKVAGFCICLMSNTFTIASFKEKFV